MIKQIKISISLIILFCFSINQSYSQNNNPGSIAFSANIGYNKTNFFYKNDNGEVYRLNPANGFNLKFLMSIKLYNNLSLCIGLDDSQYRFNGYELYATFFRSTYMMDEKTLKGYNEFHISTFGFPFLINYSDYLVESKNLGFNISSAIILNSIRSVSAEFILTEQDFSVGNDYISNNILENEPIIPGNVYNQTPFENEFTPSYFVSIGINYTISPVLIEFGYQYSKWLNKAGYTSSGFYIALKSEFR